MKRDELDTILRLLEANFSKKKIRKTLKLSTQSLSNRLAELEKLGLIKRIGKYEVQLLRSSSNHPRVTLIPVEKKLNKRGHAHNATILFPSEENLKEKEKVINFVNTKKPEILKFGSIKFKHKNYTIWINKNSLTVYSNNSYYAEDALHAKFRALQDLDLLVKNLKQRFGFTGVYGIELFREHYGLIFNKFAEWILSKGKKLNIKNNKNKTILWVDDSRKDDKNLKEFEGEDPLEINAADKLFESHERTKWEVTPEFQLEALEKQRQVNEGIIKIQQYHSHNIIKHQKVLDEMLITLKKIQEGLDAKD